MSSVVANSNNLIQYLCIYDDVIRGIKADWLKVVFDVFKDGKILSTTNFAEVRERATLGLKD